MSWQLSILFATTFYSIARAFSHIKENKGIISCVIGHLGLSIGCMIAFLDIMYIAWDHAMDIKHSSLP